MNEPKDYIIKTLADIFYLPTKDQMERCLAEITTAMLTSRSTADLMVTLAQTTSNEPISLRDVIQHPEYVTWTDDNKGELRSRFFSEGETEPAFEVVTKLAPKP